MVRFGSSPSFSSCCSTGRPSGPTFFAFAFIAVATSSSVGSVARALATGCCSSLLVILGSSMSDFAFSSGRNNRTHLSRIRPLTRSSLPSSSRRFCDSTFLAALIRCFGRMPAGLPCATASPTRKFSFPCRRSCLLVLRHEFSYPTPRHAVHLPLPERICGAYSRAPLL